MTREIGSEFHRSGFEDGDGLDYPGSGLFVFSGRTAIETVLNENAFIRKALLPSYCCDSMIQPFRDAGIKVGFYPVRFEDGLRIDLKLPADVNAILWCNYFGFHVPMPDLSGFIERGGIVIEDITHSFLSDRQYHPQSQYLAASLRKWEPLICGGYCAAVKGELHHAPLTAPSEDYIRIKTQAMELKAEYLTDPDEQKKPQYLAMFGESNRWVAENYSCRAMDRFSLEFLSHVNRNEQRRIRKRNAGVLYRGLEGKVRFLFPEEDMDCPLFVPILLPDRDEIRAALTTNRIYCPVHWPRPVGCESNLYEQEISLVCDQRYDREDMERIVSVLTSFL